MWSMVFILIDLVFILEEAKVALFPEELGISSKHDKHGAEFIDRIAS